MIISSFILEPNFTSMILKTPVPWYLQNVKSIIRFEKNLSDFKKAFKIVFNMFVIVLEIPCSKSENYFTDNWKIWKI